MFRKITRRSLDTFLSRHKTDEEVLDVGSGGSSYDRYFPNRLTVDLDSSRQPDIVADAHALPFKNDEFGVILCTEVLEHVKNPFQVEKELWRVLKPGGKLILSTRFIFPIHDAPHDYWRFTKYGLRNLFTRWEIVELKGEMATFSALGALMQRIVLQTHLRINKLSKLFLILLSKIFDNSNSLILEEYADIGKSRLEEHIMTTGYHLLLIKK